jgi:hypothetical protein
VPDTIAGVTWLPRRGHLGALLAFGFTAICVIAAVAPTVDAARGFKTGFTDFEYISPDNAVRDQWFDATVQANADIVRIPADWRGNVGSQPPANPRDPSDPAYNFFGLDRVVREASERGLEVLFTVSYAPDWAEGPGRPGDAPAGTWKPDAKGYGDYMHALATRYSGGFPDPAAGGQPLPRVSLFEVWNEPNLPQFLNPQSEGGRPASPALYRQLLNAAYEGVHSAGPGNRVIGPALAPYGDPPGGARVEPLQFLRDLFCLKGRRKPKPKKGCNETASLDIVSHHPVNLVGGPASHAQNPDDVTSGDLDRIKPLVKAARKARSLKPGGPKPLWVTESFWYSNPPTNFSFSRPPEGQARNIEEAFYVWWSDGAEVAVNFLIRDMTEPDGFVFGTGVFFEDATPKPAFTAFRFPFVADRKKKQKVLVWGKSPASGELEIQREQPDGWQTVKRIAVGDGAVFTTNLRIRGSATLRGVLGGDQSLPWALGG